MAGQILIDLRVLAAELLALVCNFVLEPTRTLPNCRHLAPASWAGLITIISPFGANSTQLNSMQRNSSEETLAIRGGSKLKARLQLDALERLLIQFHFLPLEIICLAGPLTRAYPKPIEIDPQIWTLPNVS